MRALFILSLFLLSACTSNQTYYVLSTRFKDSPQPAAGDYADPNSWSALPSRYDAADLVPRKSSLKDNQAESKADVFFIHPTIFIYKPENEYLWNASMSDVALNSSTDSSTILNQATAFNAAGRVFAPRYRQAHYHAFVTEFKEDKEAALDVAYSDVKRAFEYYLAKENKGRPIIIAGHSQGTVHATRLLKEYFDGKELGKQLVAAYIIGIATPKNTFNQIPVCTSPNQTGCFIAYTTFLRGYLPPWHPGTVTELASVNPLTWSTDEGFASKEKNMGGVSYGFKYVKEFADAQNHLGVLWTNTPYVPGRSFVKIENWHKADINLYYQNIRENAVLRVNTFLSQK
jgi:hypothetical protein